MKYCEIIVAFLVGAAVPIMIEYLRRKDAKKMFELERKDKYRIIALEKRLDVYQRAYSHWYQLYSIIHEKDELKRQEILTAAREFWVNNCLYLEESNQNGFNYLINVVADYQSQLRRYWALPASTAKEDLKSKIDAEFKFIQEFGGNLSKDIQIEPIDWKSNGKTDALGESTN